MAWQPTGKLYVYVMLYVYTVFCKIVVELWVEVGLNKKHNSIIIYLLYLIYYDKTLRSAIDWLKYYNPNKNENKYQILNTDLKFLGLVNSICRTVSWFLETWTIFCEVSKTWCEICIGLAKVIDLKKKKFLVNSGTNKFL